MLILFVEYHSAFRQAASYMLDQEEDLEVVSRDEPVVSVDLFSVTAQRYAKEQ